MGGQKACGKTSVVEPRVVEIITDPGEQNRPTPLIKAVPVVKQWTKVVSEQVAHTDPGLRREVKLVPAVSPGTEAVITGSSLLLRDQTGPNSPSAPCSPLGEEEHPVPDLKGNPEPKPPKFRNLYKSIKSIRKIFKQPFIFKALVGGKEARVLVDTGADLNCVSERFIRRHNLLTSRHLSPVKVRSFEGEVVGTLERQSELFIETSQGGLGKAQLGDRKSVV